ncbi:hypothetical protein [Dongia sp. agr-C8]
MCDGSLFAAVCFTTGNAIDILGYAGAITAFWIGFSRYRKDQAWKRKEYVAGAWEKIKASPLSMNAMVMLDYSLRWIHLNANKPNATPEYARISVGWCAAALIPHNVKGRPQYGRVGAYVRDAFDDFLSNLDEINSMIDANLLKKKDVRFYLGYWASKLGRPQPVAAAEIAEWRNAVDRQIAEKMRDRDLDDSQQKMIADFFGYALPRNLYLFMGAYKFRGVIDLCHRLNHEPLPPREFELTDGDDYRALWEELASECRAGFWNRVADHARLESEKKKAEYGFGQPDRTSTAP